MLIPNPPPNKAKIRTMWLVTFVMIGALFAYIYGDRINAFEDHVLTVLFGKRP